MTPKPKVVVLGCGVGELDSAFYLRHSLSSEVDMRLVSDCSYFLYEPNMIFIPFGEDPVKTPRRLVTTSESCT